MKDALLIELAATLNPHQDYLAHYWNKGFNGEGLGGGSESELQAWYAGREARHAAAPAPAEPVAKVVSWTSGSYWRNYKLEWLRDVDAGTLLYATPSTTQAPQALVDILLAALQELTPPVPGANALCHLGITTQAECANCQRIVRAHAAIAKAHK